MPSSFETAATPRVPSPELVGMDPADVNLGDLRKTIEGCRNYLLGLQKEDGHWIGELFVDSTVACDYHLLMYLRGKIDRAKEAKIVRHILQRQLPDGGWPIYPGGPSNVTATVKCYFSLKLAGDGFTSRGHSEDEHLL
jgi:squalene-hopene/tetraprenyl-beta-curcumene cyclase